jgi:hypothetical protein
MLESTDLIISCEKKKRKRAMDKEYRFSKQGSKEVQEGKKDVKNRNKTPNHDPTLDWAWRFLAS